MASGKVRTNEIYRTWYFLLSVLQAQVIAGREYLDESVEKLPASVSQQKSASKAEIRT